MLSFSLCTVLLLAVQSALVAAKTYDLCPGYLDFSAFSNSGTLVTGQQGCLKECEATEGCVNFNVNDFYVNPDNQFFCFTSDGSTFQPKLFAIGDNSDKQLATAYLRSNPVIPYRTGFPDGCIVCKSETCFTCNAPNVFSTTGDCTPACPAGQTANSGRGCICDNPECLVCIAPEYYSSESKACVLPGISTVVVHEAASTSVTSTVISTPATSTVTITRLSTTTPATSTITDLATAFTGRADCAYYRVTFPSDCCPNKFIPGLRKIRIRRDLERRSLQFSATTTITSTSTSTASFVETSVAPTPLVSTTETSFVQAATPVTVTSTTAFARSTACVASTRVGLGRCPTDPKTAMESLLRKYRQSGERVVIDCGSSGLYEQP